MYACKYFTFLMCRVPTSAYEAETISIYCGFMCKTFYHMDTFSTWCKDNDALNPVLAAALILKVVLPLVHRQR